MAHVDKQPLDHIVRAKALSCAYGEP